MIDVKDRPKTTDRPQPRIITDARVTPATKLPERRGTKAMLRKLFPDAKLHHTSRRDIHLPGNSEATSSLFFWTAHECFSKHLPLALDPAVIWYVILNEVATAVKADPMNWARLFTRKPDEKQIVRVRDDSLVYPDPTGANNWGAAVGLFDAELATFIPDPETMNTMLPRFSTSTFETQIAHLVTFMDAASPFYDYRVMTMCGIPAVRMDGTEGDWNLLLHRATAVANLVPNGDAGVHMTRYFTHLLPLLGKLSAARAGEEDLPFWRSLYKLDGGSGGPYVLGWLTQFLAFVSTYGGEMVPKDKDLFDIENYRGWGGLSTGDFPTHVSNVSFLWEYFGQEIKMQFVAGVLGVDADDGFLAPRLGFGVLEPM